MEIFLLLMIKHAIIDLGCQPFGLGNHKIKYFGWPAHIKHYIPHGVLTMFVLGVLFKHRGRYTAWNTRLHTTLA